jgi:D-beta-D-heptose 7-phosphate kinase/D-beta-D-heptose 1-phosphate adenosyltransferase
MLDHYIYGTCNRISPEAPVQVVEVKNEMYTLGGAGNVLKNLKSLNCEANVFSIVGDDENAQLVSDYLDSVGTKDYYLLKDKERCTTVKTRVLVSKHQLIRLDREDKMPLTTSMAKTIITAFEKHIENYDMVLLSDYNKGMLSDELLENIFAISRSAGVKTIVDPKGVNFSKYKGANTIKPNKKEAIIASGISITDNDSLKTACIKIQELTNCDNVIVTMSEEGIALFSDNKLTIIPTKALDVIDVTGAGDTVLASLGLGLASGNTLYDACDFANHAAAVVVSKVGSATATLEEIAQKV